MKRIILSFIFIFLLNISAFSQTEILTNSDILEMTEAGLTADLIVEKVKATRNDFDVSAKGLIALKKGKVADEVIASMVEKSKTQSPKTTETKSEKNVQIVEKKTLTAADILQSSRTISIHKDSLNPSKQALEKELLKRPEWKKFNLTIVESRADSDLSVQIGFVHFSIITHRYVWRVYDKRSGIVVAAGETTSWGSLAKNLAGDIIKSLNKLVVN